jgi:hypothetical protein
VSAETIIALVRKPCACMPPPRDDKGHSEKCPRVDLSDLKTACFTIERFGTARSEGGTGVSWYCSCYDGDEDRPTCEHIYSLLAAQVNELEKADSPEPPLHFAWSAFVTTFGDSIVRAIWAENALKDEGSPRGLASGSPGVQGSTGAQGPTGVQGSTGRMGAIGPQGLQGFSGPFGISGPVGVQGPTGTVSRRTLLPPWPPHRPPT